jgi:hypothetical protein
MKNDKLFQLVLCHMKMHFQLINKMVHSVVHRNIEHSTNSVSRHLFNKNIACLMNTKKAQFTPQRSCWRTLLFSNIPGLRTLFGFMHRI